MATTNDELFEDLKQFINAKIDGVESSLGARIDGMEVRLGGVESRLGGVEGKLSKVESRLDIIEEDLHDIKVMQNEILNTVGHDIEEVKTTQDKHEVRIVKLEAKAA